MGLVRKPVDQPKPFIEEGDEPAWGLSKSACKAMIWFLSECDPELPIYAARGAIRARHGLHVEQEIRAFVARLPVRGLEHNVRPVKGEHGRYEVESKTKPGEHYIVCLEDMTCPCKGWSVRKWCGHLDSAIAYKTQNEDV